ncbi:SEC10/PgrA surface exclusion domain-containing protein [Weissella viridescens]|uniref:SEC10/PgrA surface exclusion domain-containing protein n=1 Tax=Weissella viridescens TaxID=1629 RepID=UPI003AF30D2A
MMDTKHVLGTGLGVAAAVVATGTGASADTVTDQTKSADVQTVQTASSNKSTADANQQAVTDAQQGVSEAEATNDAAKQAQTDATKAANATQTTQDDLAKQVKDANSQVTADKTAVDQAKTNEATAQKANADRESDLKSTQDQKTKIDAQVPAQEQKATDAKASHDKAVSENNQAQADKAAAQKAADAAKQNQAKAQADLDKATKGSSVADAKATADKTQSALDKAKADTDAKTTADKTAQADKSAKQAAKDKAQATKDAADQKLSGTPKTITETKTVAPKPIGPNDKPIEYEGEGHPISKDSQLPREAVQPKPLANGTMDENSNSNWYVVDKDNDKSPKLKITNGHLDESQQKELAQYWLTLVNNFRKSKGLDPMIMTDKVWKMVYQASLKQRESDPNQYTDNHNRVVSANGPINPYKNDLGLALNGSQNLGFGDATTMLAAKVEILQTTTQMLYQDGDSGEGHLRNFLTKPMELSWGKQIVMAVPYAQYVGNKGQFGSWNYVFDIIIVDRTLDTDAGEAVDQNYINEHLDMANQIAEYPDAKGDVVTSTHANPEYAAAKAAADKAQTTLNTATKALQTATAKAASTSQALNQANAVQAKAQTANDQAQTDLNNAIAADKDMQATTERLQTALNDAKAQNTKAQADLKLATDKAQATAQTEATTKQALDAANAQVKASQAKLAELNAKIAKLSDAQGMADAVAKAKEAVKTAETKLAEDQAKADALAKQLDAAKTENAQAQAKRAAADKAAREAAKTLTDKQAALKQAEAKLNEKKGDLNASKSNKEAKGQAVKEAETQTEEAKQSHAHAVEGQNQAKQVEIYKNDGLTIVSPATDSNVKALNHGSASLPAETETVKNADKKANKQNESLPNTGVTNSSWASAIGVALMAALSGAWFRRKQH